MTILLSKANHKQKTQILVSLAFHTVAICNLISKEIIGLGLKKTRTILLGFN